MNSSQDAWLFMEIAALEPKEVKKFVNQNAHAAAGSFAAAVGNFSKMLSKGLRARKPQSAGECSCVWQFELVCSNY